MKIIDQKNFLAGLMFTFFGMVVAIWSLTFKIGTAGRMGPGYFPLAVGLALCVVGLIVLIGSIGGSNHSRMERLHLKPVFVIIAAVTGFGALVQPAGLAIAVPILIGISAFADSQRSWRVVLLAIVVLLPLTWLIFIVLLGLPLPLLPAAILNT
jgi:hypothetical protein